MRVHGLKFARLLAVATAGALLGNGSVVRADQISSKCDTILASRLASRPTSGWSHVIARFEGELTPVQAAQLKAMGASIYRALPIVHSAALAVPSRNLNRLAALSFVLHLSNDGQVRKNDEFTADTSGASFAYASGKYDGSGIGIAVIDSGLMDAADITDGTGRKVKGINYAPDDKGNVNTGAFGDLCGHGTHVAGIIAGSGKKSTGSGFTRTFYGIARNARIVPVRVLDKNGEGTVSQVIAGIQWVLNNRSANNIRVINLSLGHPVGESYTTDPLCQAVESAWKAGIVVVCAAGNEGRLQSTPDPMLDNEGYGAAYGTISSPGNDPCVITVGAMKPTDMAFAADGSYTHTRGADRAATYSSRGPSRLDLVLKPDIVAPGNQVISVNAGNSTLYNAGTANNRIQKYAYVRTTDQKAISPDYFRLSGTSMAAPVVSGAAALLIQRDTSLSPDTVKARLMLSADKWAQPDGTADPLTFGAGYVNIPAALLSTAVAALPALSPTVAVNADGQVLINMDRAIWGTDATSADRAIWGVSGINDLRAVWGTSALLGNTDNILSASNAIWGTSVTTERAIWGHSIWEDSAIWGTDAAGVDLSSILKGDSQ